MVLSLFVWGRGALPRPSGAQPRFHTSRRRRKKDDGLYAWALLYSDFVPKRLFRHRDSKCSSVLNMPAEADMRCSTRYTGKLALMTIQENVPLAPLTTLQVGGTARFFAELRREDEVREAVQFAKRRELPLFVLGGGSNLVVADAGWPGLVLKIALPGIDRRGGHDHDEDGNVVFDVGAGESWDKFVSHAVMARCAGVECLSGIPGRVGGTPVQNVGAYGQEVAETIASVQVLDRKDGQVRELCREACGFPYRSSIFNTTERGRFIILRVTYALTPGGEAH